MSSARSKCAQCCRTFFTYLFSTIGLVLLVAAYSSLGGSLFLWLERDSEVADLLEARGAAARARRVHSELLWTVTERLNVLYKANWTVEAEQVLKEFEKLTYQLAKATKWDGLSPEDPVSPKWTFAGALFYAITAITTIGYGHVTPVTKEGQICTMIYALIGIPLTLMCMVNVGKFFANLLRLTYHALCCGLCCLCCAARRKRTIRPLPPDRECGDGDGGGDDAAQASDGGGDEGDAGDDERPVDCQPWAKWPSSPNAARLAAPPPPAAAADAATPAERKDCNGGVPPSPPPPQLRRVSPAPSRGRDGDGKTATAQRLQERRRRRTDALNRLALCRRKIRKALEEQAPVPSYLCLVIMGSYITGGALIFSLWEEWDYVSGAYFCFVTLTTIGFGDLVPGVIVGLSDTADWSSTSKLLLCALYLFIGLALVAMCFDLMREDVTNKLIRIGKKIGLLKDGGDAAESSDDK